METKNMNIRNHINALAEMISLLSISCSALNDKEDENRETIKTLNVILNSIRSETVLIQAAVDEYFK